ncbi:MAG: YggS family pyridoxal phosphate-dependent enzyme [Oscillospiraceae bacterium]|nr:YggS family pyridoxal phosphate-dependent enzyme [Oscillospiraceae bacterium]
MDSNMNNTDTDHSVSIAENIKRVLGAIDEAASRAGRSPGDITLVAATKTQSSARIREAIAAGVGAVGENRVQELTEKHMQGAYDGAPLHFIGHIQTNKISHIVGVCDLIESVGSARQLELIGKRAVLLGITQKLLIEINIGREPQKSGILPEQIGEILEYASITGGINLLGLMAIPPIIGKFDKSRNYFDAMYQLYIDISKKKYDNVCMQFLSMGMSDSYAEAIQAGSNMVRIGSAIFGSR